MSGWVTKKLGEVCKTTSGGTPIKSRPEYYDGGTIPWLRSGEVCRKEITESEMFITKLGMENSSAKMMPKDTVLIAMYGATAAQAGILRFASTTNQAICGILPNQHFLPEFLYYYFKSIESRLAAQAQGGAQPNISQQKIRDTLVPIPPLAEQKRIVAKIDAAFEKIDRLKANAEKNLANAKELFQSALDEAMRPKKGWVEKRLGEVCSKIGSGATPRGGKASYCSKGISLIRSMNVYDCAFEYSELAHINDMQAKELANVTIEANDVLINITGASVARCCVVPLDVMPARVNQHVAILRIADNRFLNSDFLCYSLVAPARKSLLLGIGEAGSTRQALTKNDLSSFMISIPDLFEQKRIVERIRALAQKTKTLQQNYARQIADCAEMRQAILREAFEGNL